MSTPQELYDEENKRRIEECTAVLKALGAWPVKEAERPLETPVPKVPRFNTQDVIRMKANKLVGGYRIWKITGCIIGSQHTESHYQLQPLDVDQGRNALTEQMDSLVPCWMLETHPLVEKVL